MENKCINKCLPSKSSVWCERAEHARESPCQVNSQAVVSAPAQAWPDKQVAPLCNQAQVRLIEWRWSSTRPATLSLLSVTVTLIKVVYYKSALYKLTKFVKVSH